MKLACCCLSSGSLCPVHVLVGWGFLKCYTHKQRRGDMLPSPPSYGDTWGFTPLGIFEQKENDRVWQPGAN